VSVINEGHLKEKSLRSEKQRAADYTAGRGKRRRKNGGWRNKKTLPSLSVLEAEDEAGNCMPKRMGVRKDIGGGGGGEQIRRLHERKNLQVWWLGGLRTR